MTERPGRSVELWLLALGLLAISITGWLRLQFVIGAWDFLSQTGVEPGPLYQAILGGVWGAGGLVCAAGLLLRQRWAPGGHAPHRAGAGRLVLDRLPGADPRARRGRITGRTCWCFRCCAPFSPLGCWHSNARNDIFEAR